MIASIELTACTAKSLTVGNMRWRFLVIGNGMIWYYCRIMKIYHLNGPVIILALGTCLSMHMLERVYVIVLRLKLLEARNTPGRDAVSDGIITRACGACRKL
jgi:hypothetical protein